MTDQAMSAGRRRAIGTLVGFLVAAVVIAALISAFASGAPDGLTAVSEDKRFASLEEEHAAAGSPFAGYETQGVDSEGLSLALAGVVGVAVTFLVGGGLFLLVRSGNRSRADRADRPADAASAGSG